MNVIYAHKFVECVVTSLIKGQDTNIINPYCKFVEYLTFDLGLLKRKTLIMTLRNSTVVEFESCPT